MSDSLAVKVKKAALMLDKDIPNWFRRVKRSILYMRNSSMCILGQLFGTYDDAPLKYNIKAFGGNLFIANGCVCMRCDKNRKEFEELDVLWKKEIKSRRD